MHLQRLIAISLIIGLACHSLLSHSAEPSHSSSSPSPQQLELRDGNTRSGILENAAIEIHTSYGRLELPTSKISRIQFRQQSIGWDVVETINRNRIIGLIHKQLRFQSIKGHHETFHPSRVRVFQQKPADTTKTQSPNRQYILLRGGDMLSGRLKEPLKLEDQTSVTPIPDLEIESLQLASEADEPGNVLLKNGAERSARLKNDLIQFELDLGPSISISRWDIESFYSRHGFVPREVERYFSPKPSPSNLENRPSSPFPNFVWIPPGRFLMGSESNELGRGSDEGPQTLVTLSRGFWMAQYEVTQNEYMTLMKSNPSTFTADPQQPVEKVNWNEALAYCRRLTETADEEGTLPRGMVFRLPTEAEWEYACRAGTDTRFSYGDDSTDSELGRYAWYVENSDSTPHPVGQLEPNAWGLYDMHGNVWEWCLDQWQYAYPGGKTRDFRATDKGWLRVARGGSWLYSASNCRSANRDDYGPNNRCSDIGFRVVLAAPIE